MKQFVYSIPISNYPGGRGVDIFVDTEVPGEARGATPGAAPGEAPGATPGTGPRAALGTGPEEAPGAPDDERR
jgi:hypothetical protein